MHSLRTAAAELSEAYDTRDEARIARALAAFLAIVG